MDQTFSMAPHDDIVALLIQVAVLLFVARALGEVARRLNQPTVLGEILAGVVLGPSLISGLFPALGFWLVPSNDVQGYLLETIALLGAIFMLLLTGLEIDVNLIRRYGGTALGTAAGALVVPFTLAFALALWLPDAVMTTANPTDDERLVFALFFAVALAVSAIPVIAKLLIDMNMLRRDLGQIMMAAAMVDDISAWTGLSIVVGMASGAALSFETVGGTILKVVLFMLVSFTVGRWLMGKILSFVQNNVRIHDAVLTTVVVLAFAWGAVSHALYLEAVIGAFVVGILFGQIPGMPTDVLHKLESIALGIFAPIFFAVAGLKVNIFILAQPDILLFTGIVFAIAVIGKVAGAYVGARFLGGQGHWESLSMGAALNARGAVGIIVASIGLSAGILSQSIFSIIVIVSILTSLMAPLMLRWTLNNVQISPDERARMKREALVRYNLIANANRVLVPVRLPREGDESVQVARTVIRTLLDRIGKTRKLSITLMTVVEPADRERASAYLSQLVEGNTIHVTTKKVVTDGTADKAILEEAAKGYDLMMLGAPQQGTGTDVLFTHMVDYIVRFAPCPTMIVHGNDLLDDWQPNRIMVPTNGSRAARRAAEVAFSLSADNAGEVHILKGVVQPDADLVSNTRSTLLDRQMGIGQQIVDELRVIGDSMQVPTVGEVRIGESLGDLILETAHNERIDLIIMGIDVRTGSRLYLGPLVEYVLYHAKCPVLIVNGASAAAEQPAVADEQQPASGDDGNLPMPAPSAPTTPAQ